MRLVQPFLKQVEARSAPRTGCDFASLSRDARIPVRAALSWIDSVVARTGDPDLGLHAVQYFERGGYDLVEYAARSCRTWGEALEIVLRYVHLLNEAADYGLHVSQGTARLELRSKVPLNRVAVDFTVCGLAAAASRWTHSNSLAGYEMWFRHAAPASLGAYTRVFKSATLRFAAPVDALVFDEALLAAPLWTADPNLNALLRRHAEQSLESIPKGPELAGRVRALLIELLPAGTADGDRVARRLELSRRTLSRHLEQEGTTFEILLEDVRYGLAVQYLVRSELSVHDIAFLLGYSETAGFSRAFKRWSGVGPTTYRKIPVGEEATRAAGVQPGAVARGRRITRRTRDTSVAIRIENREP